MMMTVFHTVLGVSIFIRLGILKVQKYQNLVNKEIVKQIICPSEAKDSALKEWWGVIWIPGKGAEQ